MLPGDTAALRKARGAFFTPPRVARFIAEWAIRAPTDRLLEPSCGEAIFLHEAGRSHAGELIGVELHEASARQAEATLRGERIQATVRAGDFFDEVPTGDFDAVVGNPPYVRYQDFTGEARAKSRAAALRAGVRLTGLASSWAAFTVHAALFLRSGGRLGLVLPAELLSVNYAADVRRFLMEHFASVGLVLFEERVFPGVLEEVVLLLADGFDPTGKQGTDHCDVFQVHDAEALQGFAAASRWAPPSKAGKWTASMLAGPALQAYGSATREFKTLSAWGNATLGMVTGSNAFFALSQDRVDELALEPSDVVPLSPPGSRHLRGLSFTNAQQSALGESGQAIWLFRPDGEPSRAALRYIAMGEATGVDQAYKCRVRSPWWRVPYQKPAEVTLTYMNADTPRLAANRAGVHHLNSVHGLYLHEGLRRDGMDLLPLAALNSITLLGAEMVGRAYGGGMLKLEPGEADQLPVPGVESVRRRASDFAKLRRAVARLLARGELLGAVELVDGLLLLDELQMAEPALADVRRARADLYARRSARGKDRARAT